jgi:hypothetical protein
VLVKYKIRKCVLKSGLPKIPKTHLALRTEKIRRIITKSKRSRRDMYASGATFNPSVARHSEVKDRVSLDAAYAMTNIS